ncbi:MAG: TetR/AcrR family transcriptional regulator [Actinobacteria bacterium]|nr:TetR/AcrR family transcriptional regulator [Actinomycetota bacterium]
MARSSSRGPEPSRRGRGRSRSREGRLTDGPVTKGPLTDGVAALAGRPAQNRELRARGKCTMRKLLDAGAQVFAQRGYHAARVDDIVKVADTSHGTFYLYFSNKEDLFRALALDVAEQMMHLAEDLPDVVPEPEGYAVLRAWLDRFRDLYDHYGPVIRAWTEAETGASEFGRLGNDLLGEFTRVLAERIRAAPPDAINAAVAAIAVVAMVERFNYYVLSHQVRVERDDMLDTLASVIHRGVFGGQGAEARREPDPARTAVSSRRR